MSLPAVNNNTIQAADLYGLCQPSGGTEAGSWRLVGWSSGAGQNVGTYIPSRSRGATPVSVTINTSYTDAANGLNTPVNTGFLDANGVSIWTTSSGAVSFAHVGSTLTWQY
jgi:hypothetical protein